VPDAPQLNGDLRGWFEEQFARHAALVRAAIWNRLGRVRDSYLVEDLASETWSRAVVGVQRPKFDASLEFGPWVCGIAANVCREHFRRIGRQAKRDAEMEANEPAPVSEFRRAQEQLDLHQAVADCVRRLGDSERQVYRLRFEQGLSGRATAEALGVPESTFREKHLAGLLRSLARCLAAKGFDDLMPGPPFGRGETAQSDPLRQSIIEGRGSKP
jgi:RNA polymerase sigma-70 factor (ECF subfamily)